MAEYSRGNVKRGNKERKVEELKKMTEGKVG